MAARLTLDLCGPFRAEAGGAPLHLPLRGAAILCVLARTPGQRMARADLATLIWGERGEAQARASLRQELTALRRLLPEATLASDRTHVWLEEGAVEEAPAAATAAPFLEGFQLTSPGFSDWLAEQRRNHSDSALGDALRRAEQALEAGAGDSARRAARDALAIDPIAEPAIRLLMRAEAALGNRAGALAAYRYFAAGLHAELQVAPTPETAALADSLRAAAAPAASPPQPDKRRPVLAVLPFEELGAPSGDMFADGIVEEITSALSRTDAFDVIARQSAYSLGPDERDHRTAAARLGADYLVEGSVRRAGERVRISVQLIAGDSGLTHWSERLDDTLGDVFDLQDRIAVQVAGHLAPHLRRAEIDRAHRRPKAERSAYEQVLSALPHFWAHRKGENLLAIAHLEAALDARPEDPLALGYLAWARAQHCTYHWSDDPARDRAETQRVIERGGLVAGDRPAVLTALSAALSVLNIDFPLARSYVDRALQVDPNNAWAWMRSGWLHVYEGQADASLAAMDRAEALSPLDPFRFNIHLGRAAALRLQRRYEDALTEVKAGILHGPGVSWARRMLAGTYALLGDQQQALEETRRWRAQYPGLTREIAIASLPEWRHERHYIEALHQLIDQVWSEDPDQD